MSEVTAVIFGALAPAGSRPAGVAAVLDAPSMSEITEVARAASTPLVWLLEAGAEPQAGALEALLAHAEAPAASLPVSAAGRVDPMRLGRVADADAEAVIAAAKARVVPLRHIPVTSLLVERKRVAELAPPDAARLGPHAGSEWSARLFATAPGCLVPASRVHAARCGGGSLGEVIRMERTGVWSRGETVRALRRALAG